MQPSKRTRRANKTKTTPTTTYTTKKKTSAHSVTPRKGTPVPPATPATPATPLTTPVSPASMLVTPATPVNTGVGVKRRRETQGTHEEKVREQDLLPWKARQGNWGNPSAPVDVINAVTHVFERKWVKRDSDLNRFFAMCTCLPQWFDAVIPPLNGWRQRVEVLLHNMVRAEGQDRSWPMK